MKILLVEDEEALSRSICAYLEDEDFEVECAFDAATAEQMCKKNTYAAIIVDLGLPDSDGVSVVQRLHVYNEQAHFLVCTGQSFFTLPTELKIIGLRDQDIFIKPIVDMGQLADAIHNTASV